MIYELNHVGGRVRDLDASLEFYGGLGAEVVDRLFMSGSRVNRVHIQLATGLVELLHHEEPDAQATYGLNHVGFMTDDLDGDYARLMALEAIVFLNVQHDRAHDRSPCVQEHQPSFVRRTVITDVS